MWILECYKVVIRTEEIVYLSVGEQDLDEVPEDEPDVVLAFDLTALKDLQEDPVHVVDVDAVPEILIVVFLVFLYNQS